MAPWVPLQWLLCPVAFHSHEGQVWGWRWDGPPFSGAAQSHGDPPGSSPCPSPCSLLGKWGHGLGLGDRQDLAWLKGLCWVKSLRGWG